MTIIQPLMVVMNTVTVKSKGTEKLEEEVKQFLDYCATHPNAGVRFFMSDMILALHTLGCIISFRARFKKQSSRALVHGQD